MTMPMPWAEQPKNIRTAIRFLGSGETWRPMGLLEARDLLTHLPRPDAKAAWDAYLHHADWVGQEFDKVEAYAQTVPAIAAVLNACETPEEIGIFYEYEQRDEFRARAWKILPESDRSRLLPLIKEYKAGLQ